jgi:hypothetical protein
MIAPDTNMPQTPQLRCVEGASASLTLTEDSDTIHASFRFVQEIL